MQGHEVWWLRSTEAYETYHCVAGTKPASSNHSKNKDPQEESLGSISENGGMMCMRVLAAGLVG
jgi:hypothetical protein